MVARMGFWGPSQILLESDLGLHRALQCGWVAQLLGEARWLEDAESTTAGPSRQTLLVLLGTQW